MDSDLRLGSPFASFSEGCSSCMYLLADTRACTSLPCICSQELHCCICIFPDDCLPTASLLVTFHPNFYQVSLYETRLFSKSEIKICWEQHSRIFHMFKTVWKDKANGRWAVLKSFLSATLFSAFFKINSILTYQKTSDPYTAKNSRSSWENGNHI